MRTLTGASGVLSAAHRSRDGQLHGHTWEVVAWWTGTPDAARKRAELDDYLRIFDHTVLADGIAWAEKLAEAILIGMECERVEVNRPMERLYAIVERGTEVAQENRGENRLENGAVLRRAIKVG